MIPPVPFVVRLALFSLCVLVSKMALRAGRWLLPEIERSKNVARAGRRP